MRTALTALTDELRRLKTAGVKTITVSDESIAVLRRVIVARNSGVRKPERGKTDQVSLSAAPKLYEPPPVSIRSPVPALRHPAASAPMPAPPTVALPAGDKQTRWDALLALVQND